MEGYIILASLLFSAFFSGIEIAFVSANKLRIELSGNRGSITGRILSRFNQIPSYFIGALLIGNNIALVIYGIAMATLLEPWLTSLVPHFTGQNIIVLVLQTIIATMLVLVTGEFIPKLLFRINPNGILHVFAIPVGVLFVLLSPFVAIVIFISKMMLRGVFRITVTESKPVFTRLDLEAFVQEHQQANGEEERTDINTELFQNALYLIQVKAKECMVPRTEVQALDLADGMDALRNLFIESNLSRIVIYDGSIDNIIGYVHHHDMLRQPASIREVMFPIPMIPESMPATDVMNLFTNERKTIACVVDEYGGTAGIVTLEDILEEIFGEIEDEYDQEEFVEKQLSDTEYIFSGRLEIDYLNETYNLHFPTGDYETLGGMIVAHHGSIPRMKEHILIGRFEFIILYSSETKVDTVKLRILHQ